MISRRNDKELKLQSKIMEAWENQGVYCKKTTERYLGGRPDLRASKANYGQIDIELKYTDTLESCAISTGLSKLQWITLRDMNRSGMPAVGLIFVENRKLFYTCNLLRADLTDWRWCVNLTPVTVLPFLEFLSIAKDYLNEHR